MPIFPPLRVTFDDEEPLEIQPKPRDLALAERDFHHDFSSGGAFRGAYVAALVALRRMQRNGELNGMVLPETPDALMDVADVEVIIDEADPEGKGSGLVPTTG